MQQDHLAGVEQAHLEEHPRQERDQQVGRVVGDIERHHVLEDDRDGGDLDHGVRERPEKAEHRISVAHFQVAHDKLLEQVFVFEEFSEFVGHA